MNRLLYFLAAVAPLGCSMHTACDIACISSSMSITSSTPNLVSAQDSCGQTAACSGASPCQMLALPPPTTGGSCLVTVQLSGGATVSTTADWGAPHDTACCGKRFASTPRLDLTSDAGPE